MTGFGMLDKGLTPGAMRVLDGTGWLAWTAGAGAAEPVHLLWALLLDETRASELLAQSGITADVLDAMFAFPLSVTHTDRSADAPGSPVAERHMNFEPPPVPVPLSARLTDVVREARGLAMQLSLQTEAGTEHLLSALSVMDEAIGRLFEQHGLGPQGLQSKVRQQAGLTTDVIEPDFALRWSEPSASDLTGTLRTLDAAANRAREGLRVVEDFVRFSLNDAHLSRLLKELRHELTERLGTLDRLGLVAARDTPHDVGTSIKTAREQIRQSPLDIVTANCRRVEEALRTLEEFSKLLFGARSHGTDSPSPDTSRLMDPRWPVHLEQLRYRLYTLEQALATTLLARDRLSGCHVYLVATEALCHHGSGPAIRQALDAGVRIVQLREKEMTDRRLLESARRVREWTREAAALFIMNDRADLAVLADADGVHVGQDELSVREARRIVGPQRLVGVSTHTIEQARQAVLDGADYLGVGPCFTTNTKSFAQLAGLDFVRKAAAEITLPWFAIGGISTANINAVRAAGATRIAVSSAICSSPTPGTSAAELRAQLQAASEGG